MNVPAVGSVRSVAVRVSVARIGSSGWGTSRSVALAPISGTVHSASS
jgi:hypothetical protein